MSDRVDLLCLLRERAQTAEHHHAAVADRAALDTLLVAHLSANDRRADDVCERHEHEDAVQDARLTDLLGDLALRVAGHEVGDDADHAVIEAPAETVLPDTHDDETTADEDGDKLTKTRLAADELMCVSQVQHSL